MTSHGSAKPPKIDNHHITRRSFLGTTAAGGAALLTGGLATLFKETALSGSSFPFVEATIPQLQAAMAAGQLTAHDLVLGYLQRIQSLNPTLHAVIETNSNAVAIASSLDNERSRGIVRGRCRQSLFSCGRNRNRRFNYRPVGGRKHLLIKTDAWADLARRDYSDQSSTRQRRSNGAVRHRYRHPSRYHAIAADRLHAAPSARRACWQTHRPRRALFRLQLLRQRNSRR